MSTVGFGDLTPKSNGERAMGSFLLLLGVAIFSYILGVFLELIENFQALLKDATDDSRLETFFDVLKYYNENSPLDADLIEEI